MENFYHNYWSNLTRKSTDWFLVLNHFKVNNLTTRIIQLTYCWEKFHATSVFSTILLIAKNYHCSKRLQLIIRKYQKIFLKRYKHHPSCHQILNNVVQVHIKCFAHQTGCERNLLKKRNLSQLLNYFEFWWFQGEWKLINSRNMRSEIWRWTPNNYPANIYLFKVNNINSRKGCEVCSKLAMTLSR